MEYWQILRKELGKQQIILPAAAGAILDGDRILLVKPNGGDLWHLPGGLQDLNESITQTVEREIQEELGIRMHVDMLVSVFSDPKWIFALPNGDVTQTFLHFFLMKGEWRMEDIVPQSDEISEFQLFPLGAIPDNTKECCKVKCKDLLSYDGSVRFR